VEAPAFTPGEDVTEMRDIFTLHRGDDNSVRQRERLVSTEQRPTGIEIGLRSLLERAAAAFDGRIERLGSNVVTGPRLEIIYP